MSTHHRQLALSHRIAVLVVLALGLLPSCARSRTPRTGPLAVWQVTEGELREGRQLTARVESPAMRAVVPAMVASQASLEFTYLGPASETRLLGSGAMRRQIGLKLRARDTCNLLYVMWRIEPSDGIIVSVKSNPGQTTHEQCANGGYRNVTPEQRQDVPAVAVGERYRMSAVLLGDHLTVSVDGQPVWEGALGGGYPDAGPVGVRSDNGRFEFELSSEPRTDPPTPLEPASAAP